MAKVFNWIRPGYELVTVRLQWNVKAPLLNTTNGCGEKLPPTPLSTPEAPKSKWRLAVYDWGKNIKICAFHFNSVGKAENFVEPALVKMSILDRNGRKVIQKMIPSSPNLPCVICMLSKEGLMKSACQQEDGSFTFCCKIFTHVEIISVSSADPTVLAIDCKCGLSTHLDGLFNSLQFSDVIFKVRGRDFPAHKSILSARSEVFAAMFQHPTKENLTNQIEIEDIEPDVFQELLRFIYTGRVQVDKLETMAVGLFIAADKYLLDQLKLRCQNHLLHHMSPENCVVLLTTGDLQNPTELLKEAAKFFRRLPSQVMATERWAKMEEENPRLLCQIHKFLHITK
jgi:speckle-type POZ protein